MYQINWGDITPAIFLQEYWQKKPLLIKNAMANFEDPISADELAGLAMEEEIQSRLISQHANADGKTQWNVTHGPFDDYSQFGEDNWTLLVQAANNWSKGTNELLKPFNFIPKWRLDDVMVSFSTPNGSVGPHVDQYDVFILQGEGKRQWQVGLPDENQETLLPHPDLKQVPMFPPIIDVVTEPGDLLYIPPNHPHNGVAITNAVNFSIGFQAPNTQELWSGFADHLLDNNVGVERFADPSRELAATPETVSLEDIAKIKTFMLEQINNDAQLTRFIGCQLTQCHHAMELLIPKDPFVPSFIQEVLSEEDVEISPVLGSKSLLIEGDEKHLYVCGEAFPFDTEALALAKQLAQQKTLTTSTLKSSITCLKNAQLLTSLLNKGFWYMC